MKIYSTEGIIFKALKYSETSLIVDVYTKSNGLQSHIISGVRTSKNGNKAAILRPLNIINIVAYTNENDKLSRIKEVSLHHHYKYINISVLPSSIGIFILDIAKNAIQEKEANEVMYSFLKTWLLYLDSNPTPPPNCVLLFLVEMSLMLGFGPLDNYSDGRIFFDLRDGDFTSTYVENYCMDEESSQLFRTILTLDKGTLGDFKLTKDKRNKITDYLLNYYRLHLPNFNNLLSIDVLRSIL